jgi:hypothetical protein
MDGDDGVVGEATGKTFTIAEGGEGITMVGGDTAAVADSTIATIVVVPTTITVVLCTTTHQHLIQSRRSGQQTW